MDTGKVCKLAALVCLAGIVGAQEQPVFRAGTRLVQVDVVVRDKSGAVAGLKKEDFTLLDNGKRRDISLFSAVAARDPAERATPLLAGIASNRMNRRGEILTSATILLIDRLNTPPGNQAWANGKVVEFLQKSRSHDRIGIYALGTSVRVIQELTDDPDRIARAVKGFVPQDVRKLTLDAKVESMGIASEEFLRQGLEELQDLMNADRALSTANALEAIAHHLANVPGRKTLIWISGSFPLAIRKEHNVLNQSNFNDAVGKAGRALSDANVAVYPVDARGITAGDSAAVNCTGRAKACLAVDLPGRTGTDTMNSIADLTGGRAFYGSNAIDESMQKAVEDAELIYTLGFYAPDSVFDDRFHKLTVKVAKKDADVRAREGYFAFKNPLQSDRRTLNKMLQDPLESTEIGLVVAATPAPGRPGFYDVRALIDLHDVRLQHQGNQWKGAVDLSFYLADRNWGRTIGRNLEIPDDQLAANFNQGIVMTDSIEVGPAPADLRIVVQDRVTGTAGSVLVSLGRK